jgi:hypothetical protein
MVCHAVDPSGKPVRLHVWRIAIETRFVFCLLFVAFSRFVLGMCRLLKKSCSKPLNKLNLVGGNGALGVFGESVILLVQSGREDCPAHSVLSSASISVDFSQPA